MWKMWKMFESWWWNTPNTVENKPQLLDKPWRPVKWDTGTKDKLKQSVQNYVPTKHSVPEARILLVGAIGAGKSSFFNSINSVFRGNITGQARAGLKPVSQTTKYRTYQVKAGRDGQPMAFLLCDTMGVEHAEYGGLVIEDIDSILKGHIQDKYTFNPRSPWKPVDSQAKYQLPLSERIHCVVIVMDTNKLKIVPDATWVKLRNIQHKVESYDVPLLVLLTQVDKACPHVEKDIRDVYHSCYIQELINKVADRLGIPVSQVLPVKNYSHEIELDTCCDVLLLTAMQQMLNFADNYFDNFNNGTE
ncbi:interferon-induced protein 44-like [Brienomyrus brachyistius]|uniref:interferon-induced protein 44-like n=1 Tax=Brienomyrus brachyistius TaxID=42636 RepID=UPI0020B29D3C|nr:interferon-induced protein 44-like [Brienomyrus brachyistius]